MKAYLAAPDEEFNFRGGEKGEEEGVLHNHEETLSEGPELLFYRGIQQEVNRPVHKLLKEKTRTH